MIEDDNAFEELDEEPSGGGGGNKNFLFGIISIIIVLIIVVVAVGGVLILNRNNPNMPIAGTVSAYIYTQKPPTAVVGTQVFAALTPTIPPVVQVTNTQTVIAPSTLVAADTETVVPTVALAVDTATVAATAAPVADIATTVLATGTQVVVALQPAATSTPQPADTATVAVAPTDTPQSAVAVNEATAVPTGDGVGGPANEAAVAAPAGQTATVSVLLTKAAVVSPSKAGATSVVLKATPTALPQTGIMDQLGLPILAGMALLFILIIFMARRLRLSGNR